VLLSTEDRIGHVEEGALGVFWAEFMTWATQEHERLLQSVLGEGSTDDVNVFRGKLLMLRRVMGWPEAHLQELRQVRESEKHG
jgi:hypothetical protein